MTTSALTPPVAGDTKRAFLVRNGLAKEGARGRFGKDAIAALAQFPDFVFTEVVPTAKPKVAKPEGAAPVARAPRKPQVEKAEDTQQRAEVITPLAMPKRQQKVGYAVEKSKSGGADTLIARTTCGSVGNRGQSVGCQKPINYCACEGGPKAPHFLNAEVAGTPLLLTKPVV